MSIKLQLPKLTELKPRITVIGVGGAGGNAINNMIATGLSGVDFVAANTDSQALAQSSAEFRVQLGVNLTEGLGAGSKPEIGEAAAEEAVDEIRSVVGGAHMVFVAAGMGGGTGTGAASVIARIAKETGALVVGIVTKPFLFEGSRRMRIAENGVAELRKHVDTLIAIPNQNLFRIANEKTTFAEAFVLADQVLYSGVACIVDLIVKDGLINLDFADVRTIMMGMGSAMMGTGEASGERRATRAAEEAIANPLLDDVSLKGAKGLLVSILGNRGLTLFEVDEAASRVRQEVDPEANIIVGATFDDSLGDRIRVSIVASGMNGTAFATPIGVQPAAAHTAPHAHVPGHGPATSAPPVAAAHHRAPPPIPQPPVREGAASGDDLARAISDAIRRPGEAGATWRAPGDVLIEEGIAGLDPAAGRAAHIPAGGPPQRASELSHAPDAFAPAAPTEMRRGDRRMPAIDEFPPVGQREYRARTEGAGVARPPEADVPAPRKASAEPVRGSEPRRKPGLLERLSLRSRPANESAAVQHGRDGYPQTDAGPPLPGHRRSGAERAAASSASASTGSRGAKQDIELPVFFGAERKR